MEPAENGGEPTSHLCPECSQAVNLSLVHIKALGSYWHTQHFQCRECRQILHGEFYHHSNQPYCRMCYFKRFMVRCKGCKEFIEGPMIIAAQHDFYHTSCLLCHLCGQAIQADSFYQKGQKAVCCGCYEEQFSMQFQTIECSRCGREVSGQFLETPDGRAYHSGCFFCESCHRPMQCEYALDSHGRPVCPVPCVPCTPPPSSPPPIPDLRMTPEIQITNSAPLSEDRKETLLPNLVCSDPVPPLSLGVPQSSPLKRHSVQLVFHDPPAQFMETVGSYCDRAEGYSDDCGFLFVSTR